MIRSSRNLRGITLCAGILSALSLLGTTAHAEIRLVDPATTDGWEVTISGRVNSYLSSLTGQTMNRDSRGNFVNGTDGDRFILVGPGIAIQGNATPGGPIENTATDMKLNGLRVRSGFAGTILNVNIIKQISPNLKLTFKLGLWAGIANGQVNGVRQENDVGAVDWREQFLKLEGPWGALWAGRLVGLFNRGGMRVNWYLMHKQGVGHPCTVDGGGTASCGNTGVGSLHPGRNAQLAYSTPDLAGLQLTVAVLDPAMVTGGTPQWVRTPFPRFEAELTFHRGATGGNEVNAFVNGMSQVIGMSSQIVEIPPLDPAVPSTGAPGVPADATRSVFGYGAGGWARLAGFALGGTYWAGQGLGTGFSLGNTAVDERGNLRVHFGYLGVANYRLGNFEIATSYGSSNVQETGWDRNPAPGSPGRVSVIKEVRGIAGLLAYHVGPVTFSIDGMNIRGVFWRGETITTNVVSGGVLGEW